MDKAQRAADREFAQRHTHCAPSPPPTLQCRTEERVLDLESGDLAWSPSWDVHGLCDPGQVSSPF